MDEALEVVDESLESLFAFMTDLNERTKQVFLELKSLENFRRCFTAMNFLVVPVIIAILLCYGSRESFGLSSSYFESGIQMAVSSLMFFGSTVGIAIYIYSVWQYYWREESIKEEFRNLRLPNCESRTCSGTSLLDLTPLINKSSVERLNEFARMISTRMPDRMRTNLQSRRKRSSTIEREVQSESNTSSPLEQDDNPMEPKGEKRVSFELNDRGSPGVKFPMLFEFQVLLPEKGPDLSIKIEPCDGETKKEPSNDMAESL